ncbi:MAG: hypothetical protein FWE07_07120 [Turicibacter sp.]|nr:hypothetical protein [Turicibacter sp.]
MKLKKWLLLTMIGVFTMGLTACSNDDLNFELHDMSDYGIEGDHRFYYVTMYEALQLREDESFDGILYFGFPGCPWCQAAIPVIHEASQQTGVAIFYVSRAHALREGEWNDWDAEMAWWLDEQIDMQWHDFTDQGGTYRPNIFVPQIIHLRDGVVVNAHRNTVDSHEIAEDDDGEFYVPELTTAEWDELLAVYIDIFSECSEADICS